MSTILRNRLVVLDTETTGFPRDSWSRVIELGAVLLDLDGRECDSWSTLVLPDILDERAAGALAANHITPEMLAGSPNTESAILGFQAWLNRTGARYVTSFNVKFDLPMVERMGLHLQWAGCVMERAMEVMGPAGALPEGRYGGWKWPKLSEAAEFFSVRVDGDAHRALTDARTAAGVVVEILKRRSAS